MENSRRIKTNELCWILAGYITSFMLCEFLVYVVQAKVPVYFPDYQSMLMAVSVFPAIILVLLSKFYLESRYFQANPTSLSVCMPDSRRVLTTFVGGASLGVLVIALSNLVSVHASGDSTTVPEFAEGNRLYFWIITSVFIAPIVEEVIFRGLIFSFAYPRIGFIYSIVISNLLFVLIHLPNVGMNWSAILAIATLGFACQFVRIKYESLLVAIVFHAAYNLTLSGYILFG